MVRTTLQTRLVRTMVLLLSAVAAVLIALLVSVSVRFSQRNLAVIEDNHRAALQTKSKLLVENHALALKGLVADNSFGDVQKLIQHAVTDDRDVVYGLFTSTEGKVWAFAGPGATNGMPDPKVYLRLGLTEATLPVKVETQREASVFGEHVMEISLPVRDNQDELGTIRYGLSTRQMQEALRAARDESQRDIVRSLALSLGIAAALAIVATLMSRRAAWLIAKPIIGLADAAKALAGGNREVRVEIRSNDEVEELGDAFNQMVKDLKASYDSLEDLNRNLEKKVEARTVELAGRNRDMRLVLDNVEEGFLTLTPEGLMAMEHSAILDRWFGTYGERTSFAKYIGGTAPTFGAYFRLGWEAISDGFLPLELCVEQLPHRIEAKGSIWNVRYTTILSNGNLDGMLVVIQDVTAEMARQREEQEQRSILAAFQRMMRDRAGFLSFHQETTSMLEAVFRGEFDNDVSTLKRVIHTVKGNTAIFGLERVARICHEIEDEMVETGDLPTELALTELRRSWQLLTDSVLCSVDVGTPRIEVAPDDVQSLVRSLQSIPAASHLVGVIENWRLEPIQVPLRRLAEQASALATKLGKGEVKVEVRAELIRCDPKRWAAFWGDVVHVVRNAVDHGLEEPSERTAAGKGQASVRLSAAREGTDLVISIADDGRGIAFDRVRQKAIELGLPHKTHDELVAALFADGLSTKDEVSETSGRGVGMAAVKARVEAMGGRIVVETEAGKGTKWSFRFGRRDSMVPPPGMPSSASFAVARKVESPLVVAKS